MTTRRLALVALALVHAGCELTYPWSETPPPPSDRERAEAARFQVTPARLDVTTPPGVTPGAARLRVTVTGLEGQAYLGVETEGSAVLGASMEPTVLGADVWVALATAAGVQDVEGGVTLSVCLDAQCTLPISGSPRTIPVAVHVRAPGLGATPASVELAWTRGTPAPAGALVLISETSGASGLPANLSVLYDGPSTGWLSAALGTGGAVPGTLALGLLPGALPAGTHTARVHVVAQGATLDVPVSAVVSEPDVVATPAVVVFTGARSEPPDPLTASVALSVPGGGALQVVETTLEYGGAHTGWLHLEPPPFQVPGQLELWPIVSDLPSGTHEATIRLTGLGGVELASVPVRYTVVAPPPAVTPAPAAVAFAAFAGQAALPAAGDVTLSTPFSEPIPFTVAVDYGAGASGWLTPPAAGTAPRSISLRVARTDLAPGTYAATVRLVGAGGVALGALPVTYELAEPRVIPDATTVAFLQLQLDSPPFKTSFLGLSTGGDVPLAWETSIEYGAGASGWLSAPASGTAPGGLTLGITRNDLPLGTYQATVHLKRPGGADHSTISVSYQLRGAYVTATPESLSFSGPAQASAPPAAKTVTLASADQAWTFTVGTRFAGDTWPWIEIVTAGAVPGTLTARPSTTNLPPGTYTGEITLHSAISGGLLGRIPISYTLTGPPLTTSPATVAFQVDQASTAAALQASLALQDGGTPRTFSVVSRPAWLTVAPGSGTTGPATTLALGLDLAAAGGLSYYLQDNLVLRVSLGGGSTVDVPVPLTAQVNLPGVWRCAPWVVVEGDAAPLVVRGAALDQAAPGTFRIGGSPVVSLAASSWTAAAAVPPVLPPGRHEVRIVNALGYDTGHAELVVVAAGAAAPASGPSRPGSRTAVIRDDARGAVYAANAAGWIERWRDANGLALESLALPGIRHLALTPDGARLLAFTSGAVWAVDPEAFVLPAAPAVDLSWLAAQAIDWRCAFANDGRAICANAGPEEVYTFRLDLAQGTFGQTDWFGFKAAGAGVLAARDGSRVIVVPAGATPFQYTPGEGGVWMQFLSGAAPATVDGPVTDRTSRRILPTSVGTSQLHDQAFGPIAGTLGGDPVAAVLSDDGTRAFTVDGAGRVHVWDVSAPVAGGGDYPELGTPGGILPPVSPGANVRIALSVDARTLYLVGDDALVVLPLGS